MNARIKTYQAAADHLSANDPTLAPVIARAGLCIITPHQQYYRELVESIISQQLSVKAADVILRRFMHLFEDTFPTPAEIVNANPDDLRQAGLSRAKIEYIKDAGRHILDGRLQMSRLPHLDNTEANSELTAVKGIGEWTAHMFLIFSLGRLDVLANGDLGIKNGIRKLYHLPDLPTPQEVSQLAEKNHWHPYESVACWYIWHSLDNKPIIKKPLQG